MKMDFTAGEIYPPHPNPPSPREEGVKNLEFTPSPYPLPVGERVNLLK